MTIFTIYRLSGYLFGSLNIQSASQAIVRCTSPFSPLLIPLFFSLTFFCLLLYSVTSRLSVITESNENKICTPISLMERIRLKLQINLMEFCMGLYPPQKTKNKKIYELSLECLSMSRIMIDLHVRTAFICSHVSFSSYKTINDYKLSA